jgi:hypothetical protein
MKTGVQGGNPESMGRGEEESELPFTFSGRNKDIYSKCGQVPGDKVFFSSIIRSI